MKTISSTLIIVLFSVSQIFSQVTFYKDYGGNEYDQLWDLVKTFDGGYAFSGSTQSFNLTASDMYLVKTDSTGNILWSRTYGGSFPDECFVLQQTRDSGFILVGSYNIIGTSEIFLVKTDRNGDTTWTKTLGGTGSDYGFSVMETTDGSFILLAEIEQAGNFYWDVIKLSSSGNPIWNKTIGDPEGDRSRIKYTKDSCFIFASSSLGSVDTDFRLSKLDTNGNLLWSVRYESLGFDQCNNVEATSDSGFLIVGSKSFQLGPTVAYVVKTDGAGNLQWSKTIKKHEITELFSAVETSNGSYQVTGSFLDTIEGKNTICLFNFNQNGDTIFTKAFGYVWMDAGGFGTSMVKASDGGLVIGGYGPVYLPGNVNCFLIKTDSLFNDNCNDAYPSFILGSPVNQQLSITHSNFVFPLFNSFNPIAVGNGGEVNIHCLSLSTGQAKDEILLSIFPNPAAESFKINGDVPFITNETVIIRITNMIGQVMMMKDEAWRSDLPINVGSLPDGAYSLIVQSSKFMLHQKFIKTKN